MEVLTVFLFIILFIICALFLSLLLIPIQYKFHGGYDTFFWVSYCVYLVPFLGIRGNWDSMPENPLQIQIVAAGLSFRLQPEKWGKGNKEKKKKEKEKKHGKNLSPPAVLRSLDREFLRSIQALLGDLLRMLRPKKLEVNGKFGFPEPHYTGWLAAFTYMLEECCEVSKLQIEPIWEEEHYEFSFEIEGRVTVFLMLFRVARFILARKTREFLKMLKKEKKASSAA
ncbi:MAG: hypothetical protein Q7J85_00605 [Bacillota bacterium]|nr:hypothetical protein [Bacillota bacterium]